VTTLHEMISNLPREGMRRPFRIGIEQEAEIAANG
jgi:hypothetical protein